MDLTPSYTTVRLAGRTAAININESGDFDSLRVNFDGNTLKFYSYEESKVEGYDFEMKREGEFFVVTRDNTSSPVPGSEVLWLIAMGHKNWDGVSIPDGPVKIPADRMENAVRTLAEQERKSLDLSNSD